MGASAQKKKRQELKNAGVDPKAKNLTEQGLSLALCLAEGYLAGKKAAWRVHGGGFAGTIQSFVPSSEVEGYRALMDSVFGEGKCIVLRIRPVGAVRVF